MLKNPHPNPVQTIRDYLHQSSPTPLQITFATLKIRNHQNGQLLNQVQRPQSRVILQKTPCSDIAEITVVDNMVFRFSFQFRLPRAAESHDIEMRSLPRPLDCGRLCMDKEKMVLSFRIDAPDPSLRVEVVQIYRDICKLEAFSAPLTH